MPLQDPSDEGMQQDNASKLLPEQCPENQYQLVFDDEPDGAIDTPGAKTFRWDLPSTDQFRGEHLMQSMLHQAWSQQAR